MIPCAEKVRFTGTGTETTYAVVKLARAFTKKDVVVKFEGHFHGLHDYVVWNAHGPARDTLPTYPYVPPQVESAGIPPQIADFVVVVPWNDPEALAQAMREHGSELAAVICEPVNYNSGCITPRPGMLELVRRLTTQHGALLIFDEVQTGMGRTGTLFAYEQLGVVPDIMTVAKSMGGGLYANAAVIYRPTAALAGYVEAHPDFHVSIAGDSPHVFGTFTGELERLRDWFKAQGVRSVALEATGIPQGLLSGTISAVPTVPIFALAAQLDTQAKHMLELNWGPLVGAAVVHKKSWDRVPATAREAMLKIAEETGQQVKEAGRAESDAAQAALVKRGLVTEDARSVERVAYADNWTGGEVVTGLPPPLNPEQSTVVAAVGSCGTVSGILQYFLATGGDAQVVGVQPALQQGIPGTSRHHRHALAGTGR